MGAFLAMPKGVASTSLPQALTAPADTWRPP